MDILLKNGRIIDPYSGFDSIGNVGITAGRISYIGCNEDLKADLEIDCTSFLVVPGLIDMHTHVCPVYPRSSDSLPAFDGEAFCLRNGVTTCVDAGTCGTDDFPSFYKDIIKTSNVRILAFLNIASGGMIHLHTEQEPELLNPESVASMARSYSDVIVGIKSAHYWVGVPFDEHHEPWLSVDRAIEAGELSGLPIMVDMQPNGIRTYRTLVENHLRPGDIHTHIFAQQFDYITEQGHVEEYMFRAKEQGIRFDLGHGRRSFWFRKCIPALRDGFLPDTISTDIYSANVLAPVQDMMNVMSKMLACGMSLEDVLASSTYKPADVIGHSELGRLQPGGIADVAILSISSGNYGFEDGGRAGLKGNARLSAEMTIKDGKIVFDRNALACPLWEEAPEEYWLPPAVIGGER